jgi:Flp pilus assembly protein TadD
MRSLACHVRRTLMYLLIAVGWVQTQQSRVAAYTTSRQERNRGQFGESRQPAAVGSTVDDLFLHAAALIEKEQFSAAIPVLQKAAALAPNEARIHHYLGYAFWKAGEWRAATTEFDQALKLEPNNPYTEYFQARIAYSMNHLNQAIALYEAVIASGNPVFDTYQRLGQSYFRKGNSVKALEVTQVALEQTPWDSAIHYQLGKIYKQLGRQEEAQQEFRSAERLKKADQASIRKLLELAQAVQAKHRERAQKLGEDLLSESSQDPEVLTWVGTLLGQGDFYREALQPLHRAIDLSPESFEAHYNLGFTLMKLEQYPESETYLRKALELRPNSFEANSLLAVLYVNENRNSEAIEMLRAANRERSGNVKVLALLGEQYLHGRYFDEATQSLSEVVRLKPDDSRLRYLLIEAYQKNQDYSKALTAAQDALRAFSSDARAHFEVGQQMANLGRYQDARPYYEDAIRINASFTEAYDSLGELQFRSGEYQAALQSFEKARSLDSQNAAAQRGIGRTLIRLGRYHEALTEIGESIATHPDDAELHFALSQVYTRLGDRERAADAAATFQRLRAKEIARQDAERKRSFEPEANARVRQ